MMLRTSTGSIADKLAAIGLKPEQLAVVLPIIQQEVQRRAPVHIREQVAEVFREVTSFLLTSSPFGAAFVVALGLHNARSLATLAAPLGCSPEAIRYHLPKIRAALGPFAARPVPPAYSKHRKFDGTEWEWGPARSAEQPEPFEPKIFYSTAQAAAALWISRQALLASLAANRAPLQPFGILGKMYVWDPDELDRIKPGCTRIFPATRSKVGRTILLWDRQKLERLKDPNCPPHSIQSLCIGRIIL